MSNYSELTHESPFAIKRIAHRSRFKYYCRFVEKNRQINKEINVLDYGSGDGYIFNVLKLNEITGCQYYAYEPIDSQFQQLLANVSNNKLDVTCLRKLDGTETFDLIVCAEVLEHFTAAVLVKHLTILKDALNIGGRILISVPIEIGIGGFAKNVVRKMIGQLHSGLSSEVIIRSLFDKPVFRGFGEFLSSHTGFSHKNLEYLLVDTGFKIVRKYYSPFPVLGSVANSQVFFECKKRE